MSGENLLGKLKQCNILKSLNMYACKIQNWIFGSVLTTAYHADSRKAYRKVCNNAIIDRFFALNFEKDQNNTEICQNEHRSELLIHFGAMEVRYRSKCTMFFYVELQASETYFTFLSSKVPCKSIFTTLRCLAIVA